LQQKEFKQRCAKLPTAPQRVQLTREKTREHHACGHMNLKVHLNIELNSDHFTHAGENSTKTDHPDEHAGAHAGDHQSDPDLPEELKNLSEDPDYEILLQKLT
jgi:hypothetical protein